MHLKSPTINVELLKYLNIDAVSLANNHTYDYGKKGLSETIKTLDDNRIEWFGVNDKTLIKEIDGEKISFSGFSCYSTNGSAYKTNKKSNGVNLLSYDNVMNQLNYDRENKAFSALSFHWGDEHTNYPKLEHIKLAEQIAKKKNVLISGYHPHVMQGIQYIEQSVVAYSLGNFIFDDCISVTGGFELKQNTENKKSFIFEVDIENGAIIDKEYQGFRDQEEGLVLFDIDNEINKISKPLYAIEACEKYDAIKFRKLIK